MALGVADLAREGDGVLGRGQARQAALAERVEIVDHVAGQFAQPLLLGLVVVAGDPEPVRQFGADVEIVPALTHRLDGLFHEDRVVARARPGRVDVVALPEGGRGEHDVRVPRRGREEVIVDHHELQALGGRDDPADVRHLVEEIAGHRVDHLDVGRVAAGPAAVEQIGELRRGDAGAGGIGSRGQQADSAAPGGAVARAGVAAGDADVAGHGGERVGRAVELLAVDRPSRCVAAVERRRLARRELDGETLERCGRHAGDLLGPRGRLPYAVRLAHQVRAIGRARRRARRQMRLVEAEHVAVEVRLIL